MDQDESKLKKDALPGMDRIKVILKKKTPIIWVFSGDSITAGVKHTHGQRSYPEIMAEIIKHDLGRSSDLVINSGVSGYSSGDILDHFSWNIEQFRPAIVSLMIGTNDCAANRKISSQIFFENLQLLVSQIRGIGAIPILHTPNLIIKEKAMERSSIEDYVKVIQLVAHDNGALIIDHWSNWLQIQNESSKTEVLETWLDDPIHPNGEGHQKIARLMCKELFL